MYFHASPIKNIKVLEPRISNHGIPLIYFSKKRENVLVYLSNAVEKYCRETGYEYNGTWMKWGPYGFEKDGRQRIEEYFPDMLRKTYQGVSGYVYQVERIPKEALEIPFQEKLQIPDAMVSNVPVSVSGVQFIPDAHEAILEAERQGLIVIARFEELTDRKKEWIRQTICQEWKDASDHPEYRHFLSGNFGFLPN